MCCIGVLLCRTAQAADKKTTKSFYFSFESLSTAQSLVSPKKNEKIETEKALAGLREKAVVQAGGQRAVKLGKLSKNGCKSFGDLPRNTAF